MHLVDLPDVGTAVVRRLPGSVELGPAVLARTGYGRRPGQPVLLGSDHLPALAATLTGDAGWQAYLDAQRAVVVPCADLAAGRTSTTRPEPPCVRSAGAAMLVGTDGTVVGLASGGCVEAGVRAPAEQVLADGAPVPRAGGRRHPGLGPPGRRGHRRRPGPAGRGPGRAAHPRSRGERRGEGLQVLVTALAPRPRMLVSGASEFAAALARIGRLLGPRVTLCDARAPFATPTRFPDADEVVVEWPHRYLAAEAAAGRLDGRTVLCVLTHDRFGWRPRSGSRSATWG